MRVQKMEECGYEAPSTDPVQFQASPVQGNLEKKPEKMRMIAQLNLAMYL